MESPVETLRRAWRLLRQVQTRRETILTTEAGEADAAAAVERARAFARDLLEGHRGVDETVQALHAGPMQELGHPPQLVVWCDLDRGWYQDPATLRLVEATGEGKERAARDAARRLLDEDPDALVQELQEHVVRARSLRTGPFRVAAQAGLVLLLVLVPIGFVAAHVGAGVGPRYITIMLGLGIMALLLRLLARMSNEGTATSSHGDAGPRIVLLRPFDRDAVEGEETLVAALGAWGSVTAVGQPGQRLPPLGAERVYLSPHGEGWKAVAARLIQTADLIVARAGPHLSPGFRWELEYVIRHEHPTRLLLALPPRRQRSAYFRNAAADVFPHPLSKPREDTLFYGFTRDWRPRQLGAARGLPLFRTAELDRYAEALRPHLSRLEPPDVPPTVPPSVPPTVPPGPGPGPDPAGPGPGEDDDTRLEAPAT